MKFKSVKLIPVLFLSVLLVACGGSDHAGNAQNAQISKSSVQYDSKDAHEVRGKKIPVRNLISFGDSLSDVGTYAVGTIAALGGGQFTINSPTSRNWIAVLADKMGLAAPCAAQTGLDGAAELGLSVMPTVNHPECTAYAQGGARITNPVGIGNKLTGGANASLGFLTVPVVQQIQNHLDTHDNEFEGNDLVLVMAGANDVFFQLGLLAAGATDPNGAITAAGTAASELVDAINQKIIANGGKHVVVLNIPDIAITPFGASLDAQTRAFVDAMVNTFNYQLMLGLQNNKRVLYVDAYAYSYSEYVNPGAYGLSNVTDTACDLSPDKNFLGSSLICTANNLIATVTDKYMFADRVHPTPYGYALIAKLVSEEMVKNGWAWQARKYPELPM